MSRKIELYISMGHKVRKYNFDTELEKKGFIRGLKIGIKPSPFVLFYADTKKELVGKAKTKGYLLE